MPRNYGERRSRSTVTIPTTTQHYLPSLVQRAMMAHSRCAKMEVLDTVDGAQQL